MTAAKYYDTTTGTWKYLLQGPKGDKGDKGDTGATGTGDMNGPASSTDNAIVRFDGTTGKVVQGSGVTISDYGTLTLPGGTAIGDDIYYFNVRMDSMDGRSLVLEAADATGTSTIAGEVSLRAGSIEDGSTGYGGSAVISGGTGKGSGQRGGSVFVTAGSNSDAGGLGGNVTIQAGDADIFKGEIKLLGRKVSIGNIDDTEGFSFDTTGMDYWPTIKLPNDDTTLVGHDTVQTLTNKRVTPRLDSVASATTITPTGDISDLYTVSALAANATVAAPTGTPSDGQPLILRIKDNGTSRTLTWNAIYRGDQLPAKTTINTPMLIQFAYNSADNKWDLVNSSATPQIGSMMIDSMGAYGGTGTWTFWRGTGYNGGTGGISNDTGAVGDYVELKAFIPAGIYNVRTFWRKAADAGIVETKLDGVVISSSVDLYNSGNVGMYTEWNPVTITESKVHTWRFTVTGKNASSTSNKLYLLSMALSEVNA